VIVRGPIVACSGRDHSDHRLAGGRYFVRLEAGEEVRTGKVVVRGE
jgi:hypothetical protein